MKKINIYRNLNFKDWHKQFAEGNIINYEGLSKKCVCPYGEHGSGRYYLDYTDPYSLNSIFKIKKGTKVIILSNASADDEYKITRGEFLCVEFLDSVRILLRPERNPNQTYKCVWLSSIRLIAILPEETSGIFLEKSGTKETFIRDLSCILGIKKEEVKLCIQDLEKDIIPADLKIDSELLFKEASNNGILVMGWPYNNVNPSPSEQIHELTFVKEN
jgi:hypothetical protein